MLDIRKGSAPFNTTMFFNMAVGCAVLCFAMAAPAQKNAKKISPDLLVRESGVHEECVNGRVHSLTYNTYGVSSNAFVDLDSIDDIDHVECDLDNTKLKLHFRNDVLAAEWLVRFHDFNTHFLVGGAKWNCTVLQENRPALIVRRVVGADMPDVPSRYIDVSASLAHYDEIYSDADISFATNGACNEEEFNADKKVCVGYNSACTGAATNSLPIFSNKFVTLACSDCFIDFEMDIFFELHIRGFQVSNLSTGFRDVSVNGSAIVTAQAQANWNTGIDKTLPLIQTTYLVDFKVGVVPFMVFFALPVELTGSFTFQSEADVSFGANLKWGFGTAAVSWDPGVFIAFLWHLFTSVSYYVKPKPIAVYGTLLFLPCTDDVFGAYAQR